MAPGRACFFLGRAFDNPLGQRPPSHLKNQTPDIPKAQSNGILMHLYRNIWTLFYTRHVQTQVHLAQTCKAEQHATLFF